MCRVKELEILVLVHEGHMFLLEPLKLALERQIYITEVF
jgi:hypothetical protein